MRENNNRNKNKENSFDPQSALPDHPARNWSRVRDFLIYGVCVAGILISLNFFRLDLYRTLTRQSEQPVGTITFKYNAAQRRFVDRVLWDRLQRESPVYNGDFIRTADLSEATVTFTNGSVVNLVENTLIQIHDDSRGARVEIGEGGVSADAASSSSGLVLASGGSEIAMETGAVVRAGVDGGDLVFRLVDGNASSTGDTETTPAGPEAAALSPRPSARLLNPGQEKLSVTFRWERINLEPEDLVRLEIAADRKFTRSVFQEDLAGDSVNVELETGSYFWRVTALRAGDSGVSNSLNTFPLKVISAAAPVLITPAEGHRYQFRIKKPAVRFQWTQPGDAASCLLEAADNPEMVNPVLSRQVNGTSLYFSELGPGTWYWRVRPVFPASYEGSAAEAAPASFTITQSGGLQPPEPLSPEDRSVMNIASAVGALYFSWRADAEAQSYTIRISTNQDLTNPLITATVRDNYYAAGSALKAGQYYWAVFQTDMEGNNSALSPVRVFTALEGEVIQRTIFPPDGYIIADALLPDIRFTWKTNLPFRTHFQVSADAGFSRLELDEAVDGTIFPCRSLPAGFWYWRIQARSPDGAVFESPPSSFTVAPPFPAPVIREPAPEARMGIQEGKVTVFSWEALPGVDYYQFKLYREGNRTRPVYENNFVEGTTLSLPLHTYREGRYFWTVHGLGLETPRSTRRTGLGADSVFVLRRFTPVKLDYPRDGQTFEGLQAYLEPGTVRWIPGEEAASTVFILSRSRNFSGPPVAVINNPPQTIQLPQLREGSYYWTVRAETRDGFDISAESPRLLRVLPIPLLPEAAGRMPRNGTTVSGGDLKQNRRIVFSWNRVPDATGYFFAVEHEKTGKAVIPERLITETSFTLEDLSILDREDFVWRLEAIVAEPPGERRANTRGEILRRGKIARNRFRIDFDLPDIPDLPKPGVLYGSGNEE
jgi:hypothetical protein